MPDRCAGRAQPGSAELRPTACGQRGPGRGRAGAVAMREVEAHDLQLDRQVDVAQKDLGGHGEDPGGEVEHRPHAGLHHAVGDVLGGGRRGGDDADRRWVGGRHPLELVDVMDRTPPISLPSKAGSTSNNPATRNPRDVNPCELASARPRFPRPTMATGQSPWRPSSRSIWVSRNWASYPEPRVPNDPRNERSLRTFDAFTRAISASWSEDTVVVPARTNSSRIRWYTGRRATVASGIRRELGTTIGRIVLRQRCRAPSRRRPPGGHRLLRRVGRAAPFATPCPRGHGAARPRI